MDRKLNEKEQITYQKKVKRPGSVHNGLRVTYRTFIMRLLLIVFLLMPQIIDYTFSLFHNNWNEQVATQPVNKNEAVIRVYAAKTWGLKGIFAVHTWIAMKRQGSNQFEVSQIIGWRQRRDGNVLFRETNVPIDSWWGNDATLLLDMRGEEVASIIDKVDTAIKAYPWSKEYTLYPGPNSNTFVAWIGLQVPELGLDLPSRAIGKDWRPLKNSFGYSASGTGFQVSLFGLLGTSIGFEEGLEVNVLGLSFELDLFDLAFELPLFGRYHIWYLLGYLFASYLVKKRLKTDN